MRCPWLPTKPAALVAFLVFWNPSALAANPKPDEHSARSEGRELAAAREAKERDAKKACLNGDPAKGVEILTDLYVDSNDPNYLFNQGRCYEQNDRCEDAIVRFREYLRKAGSESERGRADAQRHISDCEALLAKQRLPPPTPPGATAIGGNRADATSLPDQPTLVAAGAESPAGVVRETRTGRPGRILRVAGVTTAAVGGAALIAGIVFNLQHNSAVADLKTEYSGDTADTMQTYKVLSMVGYGAGAACIVGGVTLYWLGYRAGKTMVAPSVVAGNAGILVAGGF